MNMNIKDQPSIEERSTHRTATKRILTTAQSKSVAVASIADAKRTLLPHTCLPIPLSFNNKTRYMIKLGIAEDHNQFRKALKRLIHTEKDIEVILEADNGQDLLAKLRDVQPDIVLMDIRMPLMNGIEASLILKERFPAIKIIAFSQYDQEENIIEMNIQGVKSFIGKEDHHEELFKAIRIVHSGGVYLTDRSAAIVQKYLSKNANVERFHIRLPAISESERRLIKDIVNGLSSTEIAKTIGKSPRTVEDMREKIYHKFKVENKEQLIALVSRHNLV
jgi:two-component system response regulator DegU